MISEVLNGLLFCLRSILYNELMLTLSILRFATNDTQRGCSN